MKEEVNSMNCSEFDAIAFELGLPGAISAELSAAALAPAESCGRCAALLTETESLEFAFRKLSEQHADLQAPARVEEALLCEFRRTRKVPARRAVRWQFAAAAAAAVILSAAGILFRHAGLNPQGPRNDAGLALNPSQSAPAISTPNANPHLKVKPNPANEPTHATSPQMPKQVSYSDSEHAFLTLPYADDPELLEGGAVVRVNLSRAALESFGFPVSDLGDAEQIPADMVVSADGTPQAVRLVSQASPPQSTSN
jgi:hypothetical protein